MIKLTRQALKERAEARRTTIVSFFVEEWQGEVFLRVMSGKERDAYEVEITGTRAPTKHAPRVLNLNNIRARLVARCLVDEVGTALYDWRKPADIDELGDLDAAGLDRVFKRCQELNGLTDDDVKELTKNLPAEANGVSGTI